MPIPSLSFSKACRVDGPVFMSDEMPFPAGDGRPLPVQATVQASLMVKAGIEITVAAKARA